MIEIVYILMASMIFVLATKLRWESVSQQVADGTTSENNGSRHTNNADRDEHIRQIHVRASLGTAGPNESATTQLSHQATRLSSANLNNEEEFRIQAEIVMDTAVALDAGKSISDHWYFARGQLVLEPGESLKSSLAKTSGGAAETDWLIGYEY